jgi:hypothetical protein
MRHLMPSKHKFIRTSEWFRRCGGKSVRIESAQKSDDREADRGGAACAVDGG